MIRFSFSESNEPTHSDFLFGSCAKFGAAMQRFLLGPRAEAESIAASNGTNDILPGNIG